MVYLFLYGMFLGRWVIIIGFVVTAANLIYILYELEKVHFMISETETESDNIALLDDEKNKSMNHIKNIMRLYQTESRESLLQYIEKSQREYYDEEVLTFDVEILNIIIQRYTQICSKNDIKFSYDIQRNVKALLEAADFSSEQLCTVLGNLLDNAIDVLKQQSTDKELCISILGNGYQVSVEVKNNGQKIPNKIKEKLFNYGFSTKSEGRGAGLFIVYKIVEKLGAILSVDSDEDATSFKIIFELE